MISLILTQPKYAGIDMICIPCVHSISLLRLSPALSIVTFNSSWGSFQYFFDFEMVDFFFLMVKKGHLKGSLEPDLSFAQQTFEIESCKWEACFWKDRLDVLVSLFLSLCYILFFFLNVFLLLSFFFTLCFGYVFPFWGSMRLRYSPFFLLFVNLIHLFINICLLEWLC